MERPLAATLHLSLLPDPGPLQVLVEAAEHVIRRRPHFGVVAAQSRDCDPEGVAGYELQAVDHAFCQKEANDLSLHKAATHKIDGQ